MFFFFLAEKGEGFTWRKIYKITIFFIPGSKLGGGGEEVGVPGNNF